MSFSRIVKNFLIIIFNIIFVIIDIGLIFLILVMIAIIVYAVLVLLANSGINNASLIWCSNTLQFIFNIKNYQISDLCLTLISICLTGVLIPIIIFILSIYKSNKDSENDIAESIARADNIDFYIVSLPIGSWYGLAYANYNDKNPMLLCNFDYCFHLFFKSEIFQTFDLEVREVGYIDYTHRNKRMSIRNEKNHHSFVCLTSDSTGVSGMNAHGTNISLLLPVENDKRNEVVKDYFLNPSEFSKNIYFQIKFKKHKDGYGKKIKQMFCGYFMMFPIIKGLFSFLLWAKQRYNFCEIKLMFDNFNSLDEESKKIKYSISNIDIATIRRKSWKNHKFKQSRN